MTTPVRVPAAEATQTPAERTSESRRRADRARARSAERAPASETEGAPAGPSRVSYSVARIPVTRPSGAEAAEAPRPQAQGEAGQPQPQPEGEAAPLGEGFQVPPAPEPGITAEQVAAREQQMAAAQAALDSAEATPALMDAFAAAPPTIKAQVSGDLGARLSGTMAKETQAIQENTPDIKAEMNGNTPPPAGTITAPAATDVNLEPVPPEPTPDAESILGGPVLNERGVNANPSVTERVQSSLSGATDIWAIAERVAEQSLDNVQTRDPNVVTSPGTPPRVPQSGETDPQRFQNQIDEGSRQARDVLTQQQDQARALPGAERVQLADVHESIPLGELTPPAAESAAAPEGAQQYLAMNQPPEVQTAFDELAGGPMQDSLAEAQTQMQTAAQERDAQHQDAVNKAQQDAAEAQRQADSDQRTRVSEARRKIEDGRQSTLQQQEAAVADVEQQAENRRNTDRGEFDRQASEKQAEIDGKYQQAETDANAQVAEGERQAEEERRKKEREAEDESWLDAALDFLTDLFDALVDFINSVFDWVREQINNILTALRDAVIGLIDAIASALKSLIHAFADFLKGLVQDLLGDLFPELAAKLCALIDEAVEAADRAIDSVANALKTAVNAIVETLRAGINFVINTFQAAVNTGLALARAALTGDWATFFLQLFESACRVAGIDPASIYEFIGRQRETIQIIVDDPGGFVSNIFSAVWGGITRFADNFLTHLQNSIIDWLTGTIGSTGITLPEHFDLLGVISIVAQVLGLTWANLRIRIVRFVGERGVQVLEFVVSYVQTLIEGGWSALWERIQNDLSTLRDTLLGMLVDYIKERIIVAAVTRLATLFNPVGALVNLIIAAYQFYTFIRDQMQRIIRVVRVVADMIGNIARGILEPAIAAVEGVLAELLTLAIDLLARFLSLGNVGARVREIIQNIQDAVWRAIDRFLEFVLSLFRGGGAEAPLVAQGAQAGAVPDETFTIGQASHRLHAEVSGRQLRILMASDGLGEIPQRIANIRLAYIDRLYDDTETGQQLAQRLTDIENTVHTIVSQWASTTDPVQQAQVIRDGLHQLNLMFHALGDPPFRVEGQNYVPATHRYDPGGLDSWGRATFVAGDPISQASRSQGSPASAEPAGYNIRRPYYVYQAGHLLANSLGGPGNDVQNLAPMSPTTNNTGMGAVERQIRAAIDGGNVMRYTVRTQYNTSGESDLQSWINAQFPGAASNAARQLFALARSNATLDAAALQGALGPAVPLATVTARIREILWQLAVNFMAERFVITLSVLSGTTPVPSSFAPVANHQGANGP
jgi:flagellar biosynthesis GTPase FlhF